MNPDPTPDPLARPEHDLGELGDLGDLGELGDLGDLVGDLAAELARLDDAPPHADVRAGVLAAARREPRPTIAPMAPLDVFEHCVCDLDEVLDRLDETGELDRGGGAAIVDAYGWTVIELVRHLAAVERHMQMALGLAPDERDPDRLDHLGVGRAFRARLAERRPIDAVRAWRDLAYGTVAALRIGAGPAAGNVVQMHQWPFSVDSLLIVRSFELWTHADDVRRATGRPLAAPPPAALRAMSSLSVQSLPVLAAVVADRDDVPGVRVVLTGEGGGTHDIGTGPRTTTLVADVVDYCRLVARRAGPSVFDIEGDPSPVADLVAAAQAIAM